MSESRTTTCIIIRGPFSEADFALLVAALRQIDMTAPPECVFEMARADPNQTPLEIAEKLLRDAMPELPGRSTTFEVIKRNK